MELEAATDARAAAAAALEQLGQPGAVYVESAGRLRCIASRDRRQVPDGLPVGADVPGPGRTVPFAGGVLHLSSAAPELQSAAESSAAQLGARLLVVGPPRPEASLVRLARASVRLLGATDEVAVHRAAVEVAADVAGARSAMLALPGPAGAVHVVEAVGPLAPGWRRIGKPVLEPIQALVQRAASWWAVDEGCRPVASRARHAAVAAIRPVGFVAVADGDSSDRATEALELLADQIGRALDVSSLVTDLRDRAARDPLTGLGNVTAFRAALAADGDRPAVVIADVDGFDTVNHLAGHLAGDRVLRALAAVLAAEVRGADRLYRTSGDEFTGLLHGLDGPRAQAVGNRICRAAQTVLAEHGTTVSAGVAVPEPGETGAAVLARAEAALATAKRTSAGTCVLATAG